MTSECCVCLEVRGYSLHPYARMAQISYQPLDGHAQLHCCGISDLPGDAALPLALAPARPALWPCFRDWDCDRGRK